MDKRLLGMLLVALALITGTAQAATDEGLESSAVVEGTIVLASDGSVQEVVIPDARKYGQPIVDMVRATALKWHFEPVVVDGQPVAAKSSMSARVVLKKTADGNYSAWVKGASFGTYDTHDTSELRYAPGFKRLAPKFPPAASINRIQGTVYLALRIDRSGHVADAVALQVNLENTGTDKTLERARRVLSDSALAAARHWTFLIPTTGKLANDESWTARIPVTYVSCATWTTGCDKVWSTYVPGPYTPAPWVDRPDANAVDALANDGLQTEGAGPALAPHHG